MGSPNFLPQKTCATNFQKSSTESNAIIMQLNKESINVGLYLLNIVVIAVLENRKLH